MQVFLDHEKLYNYFGIGGEVLAPNYVTGTLLINLLPKKGLSYKILDLLKAFFLDRNQTGASFKEFGALVYMIFMNSHVGLSKEW